jgi:YVTN family beta-propeller protein
MRKFLKRKGKRKKNMKPKSIFLVISIILNTVCFSQVQTDQKALKSNQILLPYDRIIQPAGLQIYFGDKTLENHALDAALSPDHKWLAVEERYSIVFISTIDKKVIFILDNDSHADLKGGMNTYSGIIWHMGEKGTEVYWSTIGKGNRSYVVSASWDGAKAVFGRMLEYKTQPPSRLALPNEILITKETSKEYIYVVLNGNNKVIKQDFLTGDTIWTVDPGVAPYGVTMASGKLYVTNWAGRNPEASDSNVAGIPWGLARVDNNRAGGATREGSVTVLDPVSGKIIKELVVGLHPNDIISDKTGRFVYVSNSNSDNVTVINTSEDIISETISVRLQPEINPFFGDSPNGLCLSSDQKILYVANGMDNALAVIKLGKYSTGKASTPASIVIGFIPTGAYPSAICTQKSGYLYVCNIEAAGARVALTNKNTANTFYNSHNMLASISVIRVPDGKTLQAYTDTVIAVNNLSRSTQSMEKPRESVKPKPVPERIGEPSLFKHVVYIIKENRTYDQILGDMKKGDGDPGLCIYGSEITPNTHKLSEEYMLLDNFHVSGKCSAEGHQWTDASIVTDYIEKNMRAWFRSYPHVQADALVYAPSGFIWDNAMAKGKSVRIYGEASVPVMDKSLKWIDIYKKYINGEKIEFTNYTTIEPVKKILCQTYPSYGNHEFSDAMRADALIKELNDFESSPGDLLPELMVVALPNDHTTGMRPGYPTPRAMVADNDAALGRIVEAFTKSRFWQNTVIFVVEDDSQNGWDHVSAYRTVSLVISPYSRFGNVNHTYYTQPSMVRTIEQILGLPPMNIQDAIANTMTNCFGTTADLTPYKALPSNIPIDEITAPVASLTGKALHFAKMSMLPEYDGVDSGNDDMLNRILWFAAKGNTPYPSQFAGSGNDEDEKKSLE